MGLFLRCKVFDGSQVEEEEEKVYKKKEQKIVVKAGDIQSNSSTRCVCVSNLFLKRRPGTSSFYVPVCKT